MASVSRTRRPRSRSIPWIPKRGLVASPLVVVHERPVVIGTDGHAGVDGVHERGQHRAQVADAVPRRRGAGSSAPAAPGCTGRSPRSTGPRPGCHVGAGVLDAGPRDRPGRPTARSRVATSARRPCGAPVRRGKWRRHGGVVVDAHHVERAARGGSPTPRRQRAGRLRGHSHCDAGRSDAGRARGDRPGARWPRTTRSVARAVHGPTSSRATPRRLRAMRTSIEHPVELVEAERHVVGGDRGVGLEAVDDLVALHVGGERGGRRPRPCRRRPACRPGGNRPSRYDASRQRVDLVERHPRRAERAQAGPARSRPTTRTGRESHPRARSPRPARRGG